MNTAKQTWDHLIFVEAAAAVLKVAVINYDALMDALMSQGVPYSEAALKAEAEVPHYWFRREYYRYHIHPAVAETLRLHGAPTGRYDQLLLEWPHVSTTDASRLAYTRDDRAGVADRQTITTVGKYLKRHWPHLPDHTIRDIDARFNPKCEFQWKNSSVTDLIVAVELGPRSCMKSTYGSIPFNEFDHSQLRAWLEDKTCPEPDWQRHPYSVYDPRLGWGMATRLENREVVGRCLTWTDPDGGDKVFVRSYKRSAEGESGYSSSDEGLESWLESQGFEKVRYWSDGALVLALDHPTKRGYLMPYLDGPDSYHRKVSYHGPSVLVDGEDVLQINHHEGEFECSNTDGTVDEGEGEDDEDMTHCEDCGDRVHYEDTNSVGRYEDHIVCNDCVSDYVEVRGRNRSGIDIEWQERHSDATPVYTSFRAMSRGDEEYYVHDNPDTWPSDVASTGACGYEGLLHLDDSVRCTDGELRFPDDPDVVELAEECPVTCERYAHRDDAWEDHDGKWYSDEEDYHLYEGEKFREEDCWQCDGTGLWFPDHVEAVAGDYGLYHPDYFDRCSRSAEWGDEELATFREGEFPPLESPLVPPSVSPLANVLAQPPAQIELALA